MKPAKEWVLEFSQSGAFDLVEDIEHATEIVRQIQADAKGGEVIEGEWTAVPQEG